jgi:hypothetical protein
LISKNTAAQLAKVKAYHRFPRFQTTLRGQPVEVEMIVESSDPPRIHIAFHQGLIPHGGLTREERRALLCEAALHEAQRSAPN